MKTIPPKEYKINENGIEYDVIEYGGGIKYWYFNNKLHRINGPAIEYPNGDKEWYLDGLQYGKKEYFLELLKRNLITKKEAFIELI